MVRGITAFHRLPNHSTGVDSTELCWYGAGMVQAWCSLVSQLPMNTREKSLTVSSVAKPITSKFLDMATFSKLILYIIHTGPRTQVEQCQFHSLTSFPTVMPATQSSLVSSST